MPIPIVNSVPFPGLRAAPAPTLAPKWKRRRRRLEVPRSRVTYLSNADGATISEPRRSPLARALRGYQGLTFLAFLAAEWHFVFRDDPRKRLVGVAHDYRWPMTPEAVDADLAAAGVPRGARCRCGCVLVVEHRWREYGPPVCRWCGRLAEARPFEPGAPS